MRNTQSYYEFGMNIILFLAAGLSDADKKNSIAFLEAELLYDDELAGHLLEPRPEYILGFVSKICGKLASLGKFDERTAFIIGVNVRMLMQHLPHEKNEGSITEAGSEIIEQTAEGLSCLGFEREYIESLYSIKCHDDLLAWQRSLYNRFIERSREDKKLIASKIFLSHKSTDKEKVREYARTLTGLGFDVWLDEDAMHAGVELERSILQGFQDSCAAVFFITPNYEDENYLRTEINYAISEKRKKGDKFSLITLVLSSEVKDIKIPSLLEPYVWKNVSSDLAGLQEIIKALPINISRHDWKRV